MYYRDRRNGCITYVLPILIALIIGIIFVNGYFKAADNLNRIDAILEDSDSETVTAKAERIDTLIAKMGKMENIKFKFYSSISFGAPSKWHEVTTSMEPEDIDKLFEDNKDEEVKVSVKIDSEHPDIVATEDIAAYAEKIKQSQFIQMCIISGIAALFVIFKIISFIVNNL